ncbi:COX15/CtaA family protein [Ascidiimonas aurantiaca]|uniref:COX15/CtaA family protein n=1 Tax=Ascidiimonas aurantiaca TaxID=1685432 RepID=UPI0030EF0C7D
MIQSLKNKYRKIVLASLILVYLVIIAGAVVRMTGSGMGCPDWPKCFGYLIPPTERAQLEWQPERSFKKGQVIIWEESLKVASKNFTTGSTFDPVNWEDYTRHDYAVFNPVHTWTEFINRLIGALAGLATLLMAIASLGFWKQDKKVVWLSWLTVAAMVFQAWLGAKVVYSVLQPVKITIHMVMALAIVALLLYLLQIAKTKISPLPKDRTFQNVLIGALLLTVVQVVLGTQVRQFVDEQADMVGHMAKERWLEQPEAQFYIHRSFSILILVVNVFLLVRNQTKRLGFTLMNWVLFLLIIEIATGLAMYYFDFPFGSQPLHLVIASLFFGVQFYMVLESIRRKKVMVTS